MPYLRVPVIGSGTAQNKYRPAVAGAISRWNAQIPIGSDGQPRFSNCIVWVPPGTPIPPPFDTNAVSEDEARATLRARDPQVDTAHVERMR